MFTRRSSDPLPPPAPEGGGWNELGTPDSAADDNGSNEYQNIWSSNDGLYVNVRGDLSSPPILSPMILANVNFGNILPSCTNCICIKTQIAVDLPVTEVDFPGPDSPPDFEILPYVAEGGVIFDGQAHVNGALFQTISTFPVNTTVEFSAKFENEAFQHIGFAADIDVGPWIMFSTSNTTTTIFARVNTGMGPLTDIALPTVTLNTFHDFKIDWTNTEAIFTVDGIILATIPTVILTPMNIIMSDFNLDIALDIDDLTISVFDNLVTVNFYIWNNTNQSWELVFTCDIPNSPELIFYNLSAKIMLDPNGVDFFDSDGFVRFLITSPTPGASLNMDSFTACICPTDHNNVVSLSPNTLHHNAVSLSPNTLKFSTDSSSIEPSMELLSTPFDNSFAVGRFNTPGVVNQQQRLFMIGYGNSDLDRSNAFSVTTGGNVFCTGSVNSTGSVDCGQYFESISGQALPIGTVVQFAKETQMIEPATIGELAIGVISASAAYLSNGAPEEWTHKYEKNPDGSDVIETYQKTCSVPSMIETEITIKKDIIDYTNKTPIIREIFEKKKIKVPEMVEAIRYDMNGHQIEKKQVQKMIQVTQTLMRKKLSSKYDPTMIYVPRSERPEWNIVGLIGVVQILKNQSTNSRWIKIIDGSDYDTWFIK